jgi:predicted outer membrane repeat protein
MALNLRVLLRVAEFLCVLVLLAPPARADRTIIVNPVCGNDAWSGLFAECNSPNGPKRTIQAAISAAANNDIVLLTDGTYVLTGGSAVFGGKRITLRSENGPARCVVDGQRRFQALALTNGETNETRIEGITFRDCVAVGGGGGGAILINGATPTISQCVFINNDADNQVLGGAVYIDGTGIVGDRKTIIQDCVFAGNRAGKLCDGFGGAVAAKNASVSILRCTFDQNFVPHENTTCSLGSRHADGGGVFLDDCVVTLVDSTFSGNTAQRGGALYAVGGTTLVDRCSFKNNLASFDAALEGGQGGAITVLNGNLTVVNTRFVANTARGILVGGVGGALSVSRSLRLLNCTFVDNLADPTKERSRGGGVSFNGPGPVLIENTVFWGNRSTSGNAVATIDGASGSVRYSLVEGGPAATVGTITWGPGNITDQPLFVKPQSNFRPDRNSPLIDAGDSFAFALFLPPAVARDLDNNPRFADDPGTPDTGIAPAGVAVVDIGSYEFQGSSCAADCDWSTGLGVLDIFDFLCFQNAFVKGDPLACDCDTSTGLGVCDISDFLCFQNAFAQGCP